jgi:hypothetical protein
LCKTLPLFRVDLELPVRQVVLYLKPMPTVAYLGCPNVSGARDALRGVHLARPSVAFLADSPLCR